MQPMLLQICYGRYPHHVSETARNMQQDAQEKPRIHMLGSAKISYKVKFCEVLVDISLFKGIIAV